MDQFDETSAAVYQAIVATGSGNRADMLSGLEGLASLQFDDVLAELFMYIEDFTEGYDPADIVALATDPIPPGAAEVVAAVREHNLAKVSKALQLKSPQDILMGLLMFAAALRKARSSQP